MPSFMPHLHFLVLTAYECIPPHPSDDAGQDHDSLQKCSCNGQAGEHGPNVKMEDKGGRGSC